MRNFDNIITKIKKAISKAEDKAATLEPDYANGIIVGLERSLEIVEALKEEKLQELKDDSTEPTKEQIDKIRKALDEARIKPETLSEELKRKKETKKEVK